MAYNSDIPNNDAGRKILFGPRYIFRLTKYLETTHPVSFLFIQTCQFQFILSSFSTVHLIWNLDHINQYLNLIIIDCLKK